MNQFSKKPTFKATELHSPITEFALAMTATKDGEYFVSGTAIVIGPYLAITAKHVIEDYWKLRHGSLPSPGEITGSFSIQAVQILGRDRGALWNITRLWLSPHTDVAFLRLTPGSKLATQHRWRCPKVSLLPPPIGSRIVGFGYHNSRINVVGGPDATTVEWHDEPATTVGEVVAIHAERRDSSRLTFPCFQTNARFDGGMSGGPVFGAEGELCGLICSTIPPHEADEPHVSYVTTLWPAMGTVVDMDREGFQQGQKYPALELAQHGHINARGWEAVVLVRNDAGEIKSVGLRVDGQHAV